MECLPSSASRMTITVRIQYSGKIRVMRRDRNVRAERWFLATARVATRETIKPLITKKISSPQAPKLFRWKNAPCFVAEAYSAATIECVQTTSSTAMARNPWMAFSLPWGSAVARLNDGFGYTDAAIFLRQSENSFNKVCHSERSAA